MKRWYDKREYMTGEEFYAWWAIVFAMMISPAPTMTDYWKEDPMFHNEFISSLMPREKF